SCAWSSLSLRPGHRRHRDLHPFPTRRSSDLLEPTGLTDPTTGGAGGLPENPEAILTAVNGTRKSLARTFLSSSQAGGEGLVDPTPPAFCARHHITLLGCI